MRVLLARTSMLVYAARHRRREHRATFMGKLPALLLNIKALRGCSPESGDWTK